MTDGAVRDFEGVELFQNDEIVFTATGRMARGIVLQPRMPTLIGAMLVQSMIDPQRTCVVAPDHSVLIKRAIPEGVK
jgi:hypothetical protein